MVAAGGLLLGFCPKVTRPATLKRRHTKAFTIVVVPVYFSRLAFSPRPAPSQPSVIFFPQINGVLSLSGHRQRTFDLVGCRGFTQSPLRKTSRESSRRTTIARYARHPVGFRHFPLVPPTRWSVNPSDSVISVSVIAVSVTSVIAGFGHRRWGHFRFRPLVCHPSVGLSSVGLSTHPLVCHPIRLSVLRRSVRPSVKVRPRLSTVQNIGLSVHCPNNRTAWPLFTAPIFRFFVNCRGTSFEGLSSRVVVTFLRFLNLLESNLHPPQHYQSLVPL